jgi:hypothetical protein
MTEPSTPAGISLLPRQMRTGQIPAVVVTPDGLPPRVYLFAEAAYAQTFRDQQSDPAVVITTEVAP